MNSLYIVYTPYQLMSALNIIESRKNDINKIVFVNPNLEKYIDICCNFKNTEIIIGRNFYHKDVVTSLFLRRLDIIKETMAMKKVALKASFIVGSIDAVYVPSDEVICRAIFHQCRKKNPSVMLFLIDDGTGTYNSSTFRKGNFFGKYVYSLMLDSDYKRKFSKVYCYRPELIINSPSHVSLEKIIASNNVKDLFANYVKGKIEIYDGKQVVFLDQGFGKRKEIAECLKILRKYFQPDEVLVKMHPRIINDDYYGFNISKDGLPFEAIISACKSNECIIITHSSGGSINPFLIYGQTPHIVLLSKISTDGTAIEEQYNKFFERVKMLIGDNMVIPETIEEFENYIREHSASSCLRVN